MKLVSLYLLLVPALILVARGRSRSSIPSARASILNPLVPHGLSEVLYAFTSGANNNGSAFGGLAARHAVLRRGDRCRHGAGPVRARSCWCWGWRARWARKQRILPASACMFPTSTPSCSAVLLVCVVVNRDGAHVLPRSRLSVPSRKVGSPDYVRRPDADPRAPRSRSASLIPPHAGLVPR